MPIRILKKHVASHFQSAFGTHFDWCDFAGLARYLKAKITTRAVANRETYTAGESLCAYGVARGLLCFRSVGRD